MVVVWSSFVVVEGELADLVHHVHHHVSLRRVEGLRLGLPRVEPVLPGAWVECILIS